MTLNTAKSGFFSHDFSNPPLWNSPEKGIRQHTENTQKIGLLIPLSGSKKNMGESILSAAMMALYKHPKADITLIPIDSGSSEETAVFAAKKAIERGCELLIGPVFSSQVIAIKKQLPGHINLIAFSNDVSVAGDNIFIAGHSPHEQTHFIIQALSERGISDIIALLPSNEYGQEVGAVFNQISLSLLDKKSDIYFYNLNGISDEFLDDLANVIQEKKPQSIYIPDASRKTLALISKLKYKGLNLQDTIVIGSSDWNKSLFTNDYGLKGALFPETKLPTSVGFKKDFEKHFSNSPNILSEISYDLVNMVAELYTHESNMCFSVNSITREKGFAGLRGRFYFDKKGYVHRKYGLMEITGNKPKKAVQEENVENTLAEKYRNLFEDI